MLLEIWINLKKKFHQTKVALYFFKVIIIETQIISLENELQEISQRPEKKCRDRNYKGKGLRVLET